MECREVEGLLGAYLDGELDPAASASVQGHAETCAICRERLANLESVGSIVFVRSSTRSARTTDSVDAIAQEVVSSHVRALMEAHLFDVRSTDQHTVKPWFVGKLDFSPPVVDLASRGFPLAGGRLDYVGGRPVAALVYQRQKHIINVFVSAETSDSSTRDFVRTIRGFNLRHWIRDGMSFWAVSDVNGADLAAFASAAQER